MLQEFQITLLAELVYLDYQSASEALVAAEAGLSTEAVTAIEGELSDIVDGYDKVKTKHVRVAGGSSGVDVNYDRDRSSLRNRACTLLKISTRSSQPSMMQAARARCLR